MAGLAETGQVDKTVRELDIPACRQVVDRLPSHVYQAAGLPAGRQGI
jgi:hypothetical protein